MSITRRRFISLSAAAVGTVSVAQLLSACGTDSSEEAGGSGGSSELTYLNHSRGQVDALAKLTDTYASTTGTKVTVDTPGPADYLAKLQAKAQSDAMPDIFSAVGIADMAPYYKAGWAVNLQPELAAGWDKNFTPAAIGLSSLTEGNALGVDPGTYSVHWEMASFGLMLNTETYQKAGVDPATPPANTTAWIEQLKAVGKTGSGPFSIAASLAPTLVQAYASNWLTDEEINATLSGSAPWQTDAWRKALQFFVTLTAAGVIAGGTLPGGNDDNASVEKSFFNVQDLATIFDGSFAIGVAKTTAPDFTSYISSGLPKADDATQEPRAAGIAGRGAAINAKGPNKDEALKFVRWLTEPAQQQVFVEMAGIIPSNPELLSSGTAGPQVKGFASLIENLQIVPAPMTADVKTALSSGAQSLVLKETTVDDVLADVQAAQDKTK
jgi:raffinose/stachyose/melibiose transport system substrate-binding protein